LIGRRSFLIMISRFISAALSLVALTFMTRYLNEAYGQLSYSLAFLAIIFGVADLGFAQAHIKRVSEGNDLNDCVSTYATVKLCTLAGAVAVTLALLFSYDLIFPTPMEPTVKELVYILLAYYVFYGLAGIATLTFDARLQTTKTQLSVLVDPLIRVPLVIFLLMDRQGVTEVAWAYVLGGLATVCVALFYLFRDKVHWTRPTLFRSYLRYATPVLAIVIASTVLSTMDKLVIGTFISEDSVRFYSSSQNLLSMFLVVSGAVAALAFPAFSMLDKEGRHGEIRSKSTEAIRYISMIILPMVVVIILFPVETAIIIFGGTFADSGKTLNILSVSIFLSAIATIFITQLYAINEPKKVARIYVTAMLLDAVLLFLLVPHEILGVELLGLSYVGAAIANLITYILVFGLSIYYASRQIPVKLDHRPLKYLTAIAAAAMAAYGLSLLVPVERWYDLVLVSIVSYCVFALVLLLLKELQKRDLDFFLDVVNLGEMMSYIRSELRGK
jgi:O-antigen/teichoic acid export membrane protein